ncbi:hypothetical protein KL864_04050 [Mycolicibacterium goodii]|uniref:hypothetical protein n=1 Tax=Mycolicibacterium goodii TaxID=134601 RepID=UPI001BDCA348|nr:hypothetical protein [Mycolicibacterium goodii]MBU8815080.1 hypothetical protein [Mycolicibacterium goodii]
MTHQLDRPVRKIVKADVEKLVVEFCDGTGSRGVWARTIINPMLARWRSVWKDLQAQGVLPRNVRLGGAVAEAAGRSGPETR